MPSPVPAAPLSDEQAREVFRLWELGESREAIAAHVGRSVSSIFDRGRARRRGKGALAHPSFEFLEVRQGRGGGRRPGAAFHAEHYVTEAEAEQRKLEVQSRWSPEEREARRGCGRIDDRVDARYSRTWTAEPVRGHVSSRRLDCRPRCW